MRGWGKSMLGEKLFSCSESVGGGGCQAFDCPKVWENVWHIPTHSNYYSFHWPIPVGEKMLWTK